MIPRAQLKKGMVILCKKKPGDWLGNAIGWFEWGQSSSPEYSHVALVDDQENLVEQFWPHPSRKPLTTYDDDFDKGFITILDLKRRPAGFDERFDAWVREHMDTPYGLDDLGDFARIGLLARVWPWAARKVKSWNIRGEHSLVCSQWAAKALAAGLNDDFWCNYDFGDNQITPGDFLGMKQTFTQVL